jgi:hypothetical protein
MKPYEGISLDDAIKAGRLDQFIRDAEKRLKELGFDHPEAHQVEAALKTAIKRKQSTGQT